MSKRKKAKGDPYDFEPLPIKLEDLPNNEVWGRSNLLWVRLAIGICMKDRAGVEESCRKFIQADDAKSVETMMDEWQRVTDHLKSLVEVVEAAKARMLLTFHRLMKESGDLVE